MRHMFSKEQLIKLIQEYAPEVTPEEIELVIYDYLKDLDAGTIAKVIGLDAENGVRVQNVMNMLTGKAVRILSAPSSTTLSDAQKSLFENGCFVDGEFLGYKNPVFFPMRGNVGIMFGINTTVYNAFEIRRYTISDNTISTSSIILSVSLSAGGAQYLVIPQLRNVASFNQKDVPSYPSNTAIGQLICRKGVLEYYVPVSQDGVTSGDTIALDSDLGKALKDHLEVEINGYRARYQYTDGNYVVYSSMAEADSGVNLQVNMISYNTTNGTLSFNQMKFAPVV